MQSKNPSGRMRKRLAIVMLLTAVVGFAFVAIRLFYMQVVKYDFYEEQALTYQTRDTIVTPKRGTIYDCNKTEFAVSASTQMIIVNPANVVSKVKTAKGVAAETQQTELAKMLSEQLGLTYDSVLVKVQKTDSQYQVVARGVEQDVVDAIEKQIQEKSYTGIEMAPDSKRYYPYGSVAAQLIGFLNGDGEGIYGVEAQYNDVLTGTAGRVVRAQNARNEDMPFDYTQYVEAQDGDSIVLTIDESIQRYLEKNLETALADNPEAKGGATGIVMNVKTGEILAMASKPDFDLNAHNTIADESLLSGLRTSIDEILAENNVTATIGDDFLTKGEESGLAEIQGNEELMTAVKKARSATLLKMWRNTAVQDSYEPGSTFKLLNVASALEAGVVSPDSTFYCGGSKTVGDRVIHCWKTAGHGSETLEETLMNSCNVAMMDIAAETGIERFYDYFKAFGMSTLTEIDLPGEGKSIFHGSSMTDVDLATASFGQSFQVTPIQMISMVSAIVDDGKLKKPHVLKEIIDSEGNVKETTQTEVVRQVVSADTSAFMRQAMEAVVSSGTGKNGYVAGYRIGGKTATSEILPRGQGRYTASFIGVAPINDPEIAVIVIVSDLPASVSHSGGAVAAPVVARICSETLPYLGYKPDYDEEDADRREVSTPGVIGSTKEEAERKFSDAGLECTFVGEGNTVTDQVPSSGVQVPVTAKAVLYLGGSKPTEQIEIPNVRGLSPDEAQAKLAEAGIYMKRTGVASKNTGASTVAVKQSPVAGVKVGIGMVVTVEFSNTADVADAAD